MTEALSAQHLGPVCYSIAAVVTLIWIGVICYVYAKRSDLP